MANDKTPINSFQDRYATDPEFKRQVDEGRRRTQAKQSLAQLKESLAMSRGERGAKKKFY